MRTIRLLKHSVSLAYRIPKQPLSRFVPLVRSFHSKSTVFQQSTQPEDEEYITVQTNEGAVNVKKSAYREKILPEIIKEQWNDPDNLYMVIVKATEDGFTQELESATQHLIEIDPIPERAHSIRSIVLMKNEKNDEAEQTLQQCISKNGKHPIILTNLAKTYWKRDMKEKAVEILYEALQLDPNQENGF